MQYEYSTNPMLDRGRPTGRLLPAPPSYYMYMYISNVHVA